MGPFWLGAVLTFIFGMWAVLTNLWGRFDQMGAVLTWGRFDCNSCMLYTSHLDETIINKLTVCVAIWKWIILFASVITIMDI